MVDNLSESADDIKYNIDVKYTKNLYPVFMKELQKYEIGEPRWT